jgi:leucyl-tRNA synthetase
MNAYNNQKTLCAKESSTMEQTATIQTFTLNLPNNLFERIRRLAQKFQKTEQDILLDALTTALPPLAGVAPQLADELAELTFLNDAALWRIARSTLPEEQYNQMDELLAGKGQGKITITEQQTLDELTQQSQHLVLKRGQAAVLLQQRGYNLSNPEILNSLP